MTKTEEIMELVELFGNAMAKDELNQTSTQSATPYYKLKSAIEELVADTETIHAKERERCAKVCTDMQGGWASSDHLDCAEAIRSLE